jgi:peptidyl-prolyl cis-trans isomerase D
MISWIQKYFQRHFRTIFAGLLVITIVTFILGINVSGGFGRASRGEHARQPFFDLDLGTAADSQRLIEDAALSQELQIGISVPADARLQNYAYRRHTSVWLADQFHLPTPSKAELDAYVRTLGIFANPATGQFDPSRYNTILDNIASHPKWTLADVTRVLSDDVRASQIEKLLAGPGYLLPAEARALLELNDSSWTLAVATVDYASFAPAIPEPTPAELEKFFADQPVRYEIPPQVRVDAIEFPSASFLPKVTLTDKEIRAYYDSDEKHTLFPLPPAPPELLAQPKTATEKADADFASVRPKVEETLRLDRARRLAEKAAADLSVELFNQKVTPATLAAFLTSHQLAAKPLAPFSVESAPADLGRAAATAAFRLGADRPISDELPATAGAVILVWRELLPARQPAFAEVREKVAADWRATEKTRRFTELGRALRDRLAAAVKAGEKFEAAVTAAAASASSAKLETKSYTGFTLAQKRNSGSFDPLAPLLPALETLQQGGLSDMVTPMSETVLMSGGPAETTNLTVPKEGLIAYAVEKKLPDPASPESALRRAQLARQASLYAANMALVELVRHELPQPPKAQP